jgi:hypothetical protein
MLWTKVGHRLSKRMTDSKSTAKDRLSTMILLWSRLDKRQKDIHREVTLKPVGGACG